MNTLFQIELYSQAEKNRILDGLKLLILKNELEVRKMISGAETIRNRWTDAKIRGKQRHIKYLESLYTRIKQTKGKKPKYASQGSDITIHTR